MGIDPARGEDVAVTDVRADPSGESLGVSSQPLATSALATITAPSSAARATRSLT
jgi:hypothetical protein